MMIATVFLAATLTVQEAELEAKVSAVVERCAAHYRALDAAATPLMKDAKGEYRIPHGWNKWRTGKNEYDMRSMTYRRSSR